MVARGVQALDSIERVAAGVEIDDGERRGAARDFGEECFAGAAEFQLDADVARPMLSWRNEYFAHWPYVKNLVPHHSLYSFGRMQEVWLDR